VPRLTTPREEQYDALERAIGKTPLIRLANIPLANECVLYAKEEYRNPTGSHYDRETIRLLRAREEEGRIRIDPRRPLVETTTGNSGASFAWLCRVLGYRDYLVFIPADMPTARIEQIRSYGAKIELTPAGEYITGLVAAFQVWWRQNQPHYYAPNHSNDEEHTVGAMRDLGKEILAGLKRRGVARPTHFVAALGNGASSRGVGEVLMEAGADIVGVEPYESPTVLEIRFPDQARALYPDGLPKDRRHTMYGTGPGAAQEIFPNMRAIMPHLTAIKTPRQEEWKPVQQQLADLELRHVGHSSAACVWAAMELSKTAPPRSVFVTLFYDPAWKYLSWPTAERPGRDGEP
jgi:cysteine synthase A